MMLVPGGIVCVDLLVTLGMKRENILACDTEVVDLVESAFRLR
jgi:hypothetical protein